MVGFIVCCESNLSKEEEIKKLDMAIQKARAEMETSIVKNGRTSNEALEASRKLDPLIAHKQRMLFYGQQV